jgi:hypothetical protein
MVLACIVNAFKQLEKEPRIGFDTCTQKAFNKAKKLPLLNV